MRHFFTITWFDRKDTVTKRIMRHLFCGLACLCFMAMPTMAGSFTIGDLQYTVTDSTALTISVAAKETSVAGNITIPQEVEHGSTTYTVTSIGDSAFAKCTSLTSIIIPNSVTSIGKYAFLGIDTLYYGGPATGALWGAKRRGSIVDGDFTYADLEKEYLLKYTGSDSVVVIPEHVKIIGDSAFYNNTKVEMVTIPESVTNIGRDAFYGVNTIIYKGSATGSPWRAGRRFNGELFDGDFIYADEQKTELEGYIGWDTAVVIPEQVKTIGSRAFYKKTRLKSVIIPASVTSIGASAFSNCKSLTSVTIPESVTAIESSAFYNCTSLTSITIPKSVTSIGISTFSDCTSLTSVTIPESITSIGNSTFSYCTSLTSVTIPESVTIIGSYAFYYCTSLASVSIPKSVTSIEENAFKGVDTLHYAGIATGALWGAKHRGYHVDGDFTYADLEKEYLYRYIGSDSLVVIPEHVKIIDDSAFYNNTKVEMVTIPESVTNIGRDAFYGVNTIIYKGSATGSPWRAGRRFNGELFDGDFIYADEQKTELEGYIGWDTAVVIPEQVKIIGSRAFYQKTRLKSVTIPASVTTIKNGAFEGCSGLTAIEIPESVTTILANAFRRCTSLTHVTLPSALEVISSESFSYCENLKSVIIPTSVTKIETDAFRECTSLNNVKIPKSVISISDNAFLGADTIYYDGPAARSPWRAKRHIKGSFFDGDFVYSDEQKTKLADYIGSDTTVIIPDQVEILGKSVFVKNTKLTTVTIPSSVVSIENSAFNGCTSLKSITIPEAVTSIEDNTFQGCTSLTSATIPETVTSIGYYAFDGCTSLKSITIPNSVTSIDEYAFRGIDTLYYGGPAPYANWGGRLWGAKYRGYHLDGDFTYADLEKECLLKYTGTDSVVVIPEHVKVIGDSAFFGNTKMTSVTLPDSITVIGATSFKNCTGLSSLTVPNSVTRIGTEAFRGIDTVCYLMGTDTILIIKDFYNIHNLQELLTYRDMCRKGGGPSARLDADIDLSPVCGIINGESISWETIAIDDNAMFDGGNHTISNLYINGSVYYAAILDGRYIKNLTVKNAYIKGTYAAGITSSTSCPFLSNCHFEGVAIGSEFAGGLNLYGKGSILVNCSNYGLVISSGDVNQSYGVGIYAQEPINCYNRGRIINWEGEAHGIGMYCCDSPRNCYNAGAITAKTAYSIFEAYRNCFNLKIEGVSLINEENIQEMDSSAFLSGAVTDSLNQYVAQNPKTYDRWTIKDSIPLLPWVQGEDGFPRFEGVNLQPTQGYAVRFKGEVNDIEVSRDGTIALPVSPDGYTYIFANDFDGKNIVSDTTVTVSKIENGGPLKQDGDGFYLIHNGAELAQFRDMVNEGAVAINGRLANDIDLSQECKDSVWIPIGFNKNGRDYIAFEGVFDGAGHSIEHLYNITDSPYQGESTHWYRGLFGNTKNATIQNVVVKNSRITGFCVSAIVASAENTTIVNCGSEAELYGYSDHGAASMCAIMERNTKVINCYNLGVVGGEYQAAAIACHTYGNPELVNCYSSAIITLNYRSGNEETGPFCQVEHCVRCFTDSEICNFNYEREGVTKTSTDYIKSDAFLADMNAWVDSMNAAQSEIVFARWVRDEVDGYPKLQPTHTSSSLPDVRHTTPDGISVYAVDGTIYIRSAHAGKATLYDLHGKAVASVAYTEGLTMVDGLREGVYIVCGVKVIVRRGK